MKRKKSDLIYEAIAQIVSFPPSAAVELFAIDSSETVLFFPGEKVQIGQIILRENLNLTKAEDVLNPRFRACSNSEEICCFVEINNYGTFKLVRDKLQMILRGSFCWKNNLFYYYSTVSFAQAIAQSHSSTTN